jgi:hypothetical protein
VLELFRELVLVAGAAAGRRVREDEAREAALARVGLAEARRVPQDDARAADLQELVLLLAGETRQGALLLGNDYVIRSGSLGVALSRYRLIAWGGLTCSTPRPIAPALSR